MNIFVSERSSFVAYWTFPVTYCIIYVITYIYIHTHIDGYIYIYTYRYTSDIHICIVYQYTIHVSLSLCLKLYNAKSSQGSCHQHSAGLDGSDSLKTISGGESGWPEVQGKTVVIVTVPSVFFWGSCHREQGEIGWHIFARTHLFKKKTSDSLQMFSALGWHLLLTSQKTEFWLHIDMDSVLQQVPGSHVVMLPGVEAVGVLVVW